MPDDETTPKTGGGGSGNTGESDDKDKTPTSGS